MIENQPAPRLGRVTALALVDPVIFGKLPEMDIAVAIDAIRAQGFVKHPFAFGADVNGFVALGARRCQMLTEE